ncbi:MAG: homoserine dehydrogenase [Kiritimatiellae bacterium]|jgi:homoserine dehydrogenase|nr:homoserine dehydrogenase [Kiritimatiellia bacterium]
MREIGIGLLGFGTIGAGVVEGLQKNADLIADRLGAKLVVKKIADLDITSDRGVKIADGVLSTDASAVIADPEVEIVVELVGGISIAKRFVMEALELGKPVVTANKALLAEEGEEIFIKAADMNTDIYFGASVGGGIPIIRGLREGFSGNRIESIYGILNGTCNYILTKMESEGLPFDVVLKEAMEKGYAEADPTLDIDGYDTAHKAVILASLAYGFIMPWDDVKVEGIRNLSQQDVQYADSLGYKIKLLAVIKNLDDTDVEVQVRPALVSNDHLLAAVNDVFNAIMVRGNLVGDTLFYGRGAGKLPTASTVIGDLVDIARNMLAGTPRMSPAVPVSSKAVTLKDHSKISARYYVRLALNDEPDSLATITKILADNNISIASVLQQENDASSYVPVVVITHSATEADFDAAFGEMDAADCVNDEIVKLRIED